MSLELHLHPADQRVDASFRLEPAASAGRRTAEHTAYALSWVVAVLMAGSAAWGLLRSGVYHEIPWAAQALRGGDLVSLVVATPLLVAALVLAARGSQRARLVWAGVLGYAVYNYAYFAFGATFNDLFLAHILLLALSAWALVFLLVSLDRAALAARFGPRTPARWVAGLFGVTVLVLAGMWTFFIVRQMATGELPSGAAPPAALHMVYATDLSIFVSSLALAAVLLWRRTGWGYLAGTVMAVTGATYLVNLMAAQAFQAHAHVAGVAAFAPVSLGLVLAYAAAALALLLTMRPAASHRRPG